jgi:ATP-dependent RNA helicase RhlE
MTFDKLNLSKNILKAVASEGYTTPTDVQAQSIPVILEGNDVLAGAQTGTGKTAAFTLPMLELLKASRKETKKPKIKGLILTPTRELAEQVEKSIRTYGKFIGVKSMAVYGGVNIGMQQRILRGGIDILVATPGRLLDHVKQRSISLSDIEIFVLDEADRMLDMGFVEDIDRITSLIPDDHQTLFFSATFSSEIKRLASSLLKEPVNIEIEKHNTTNTNVRQVVYPVSRGRKVNLLVDLLEQNDWKQVLVFTKTKRGADELSARLKDIGVFTAAIHGDKPQQIRTKTLRSFKNGNIRVLVATDVASRGIDINKLPCVINFELPSYSEDYVHRIGRTGRGGNSGVAISLVSNDEVNFLESIEKLIKNSLEKEQIEGYEYELRMREYTDKSNNVESDNRRGNNRNSRFNRSRRGNQRSRNGNRDNRSGSRDNNRDRDHKGGNREHSRDRDHKGGNREHSRDRDHKGGNREHSRDRDHKSGNREHSRDRDHKGGNREHSRDRDNNRNSFSKPKRGNGFSNNKRKFNNKRAD